MNKNDINLFINKAVQKTKSRELGWSLLPPGYDVKPLSNEEDLSVISNLIYSHHLMPEHSYFAFYKKGDILLLVYPDSPGKTIFYPPNDCHISLRMQDNKEKYSVEIANTNYDTDTKAALIRLYNLIDKRSFSVNALIDDFLNS